MRRRLWTVGAVLAATVLLVPAGAGAAEPFGPPAPPNPGTAGNGTSSQHGDSAASDTSPLPGPGARVRSRYVPLGGACPSVLLGDDGYPIAVCTEILTQAPRVYLLDPSDGHPLTSLALTKGDLFGGVYPYVDDTGRLVVVDGDNDLLRIGHTGARLTVDARTPLPIGADSVVGLTSGYDRRVWFATAAGTVGTVEEGTVRTLRLPAGERVANSIATAPQGTAVATDHALYLLTTDDDGTPRVQWRQAYDRGPGRKPGQLSWGTGATPTFFGPATGTEYLTITDNAAPRENLLVFGAADGDLVCAAPVLTAGRSATENSPIGSGRSVFVASTYGYPYPALPADAGPSVPANALPAGGMTRIDVGPDGCTHRWTTSFRSAAVPKLSLADGTIYTTERRLTLGLPTPFDSYRAASIDPATGAVLGTTDLGVTSLVDTMQLAGTIAPGRVLYQGTLTGVLRITPA